MDPVAKQPAPRARSTVVTEAEARVLLLVRAVEDADPHGRLLTLADRRAAGHPGSSDDPLRALLDRAFRLRDKILGEHPAFEALDKTLAARGRLLIQLVVVVSGFVGWKSSTLVETDHRVHLVGVSIIVIGLASLPILMLLLRRVIGRRALDAFAWVQKWTQGRLPLLPAAASEGEVAAARQYASLWAKATEPLQRERITKALHLAAISWALGAVVAMLWIGWMAQYELAWEAEWLSQEGALCLARVVLAPVLLGGAPPPLDGPAGPWVLRFAGALLLWVVLPRAVLATRAHRRARTLAKGTTVDLTADYFRDLLRASRAARICVIPYAVDLAGRRGDALQQRLTQRHGPSTDLQILPTRAYGDLEVAVPECDVVAVVFSVRATPETEVHSGFLHAVAAAVGDSVERLVVIDGTGPLDALRDRIDQRKQAWLTLATDAGFEAIVLGEDPSP